MRAPSALFRLLLALSLVVNGTSSAFAGTQMLHGADDTHAPPAAADSHADHAAAAAPPCHETQGMPAPHAQLAEAADHEQGSDPHADCCQAGACSCPCATHASAALVGLASSAASIEHSVNIRPMSLGHASPALPHLIRPPIG